MTTVSTIAIDAALLRDLRDPQGSPGTIHSVFTSVVNVAASHGLWSLAARQVPPGPRTVRLALADFHGLALATGTPVALTGSSLRVGSAHVELAGASNWEQAEIRGPVLPHRLASCAEELARHGVPGGALPGPDPFSQAVAARIVEGLDRIATAIGTHDAAALRVAIRGLIGLGTGLTPAGDDVLTGLAFAAAQLGGPLTAVPAAVMAAAVPGSSHDISLTALRQACAGRAVQPLSDLLAVLCGQSRPEQLPHAVAALLAIGHTSGTDLAHGLIAAARLCAIPQTATK